MMAARPAGLLCSLDLPPLSQAADETLRRVRVFLFSAQMPAWQTLLIRAGYTPEEHARGVFLTSHLSGERSFAEWRMWRALRPPRDPDLPELVAELSAFAHRWLPRAREAAQAVITDPGDLEEILDYLGGLQEYPSETWRAKATIARLRGMEGVPLYQPVWAALVAQRIPEDLAVFDRALNDVQEYIRTAPFDRAELDDVGRAREKAAVEVRGWLDQRRTQLAYLNEEDLTVLALGSLVPPPGFSPSISLLAEFGAAGNA